MTMPLYLDTEFNGFNGFNGDMISLAIYNPDNSEDHFYEVCFSIEEFKWHPWVLQHVVPVIHKDRINSILFRYSLIAYLDKYKDQIIYADWAEDFIHLLKWIYGRDGQKLTQTLKMELITTPDTHKSKIPHNALEDAKALCLNHLEMSK